jgi:hypothetical protein
MGSEDAEAVDLAVVGAGMYGFDQALVISHRIVRIELTNFLCRMVWSCSGKDVSPSPSRRQCRRSRCGIFCWRGMELRTSLPGS